MLNLLNFNATQLFSAFRRLINGFLDVCLSQFTHLAWKNRKLHILEILWTLDEMTTQVYGITDTNKYIERDPADGLLLKLILVRI